MSLVDPTLEQELVELERLNDMLEVHEVERDLRKFIPLAWPIIEPKRPYIHNWHIDAIADHLMGCSEGHIQNLAINIPPRHMKSITVSVFWPAWEWIRKAHTKWLFVSYARNLVVRDAVKTRRILSSEWYQRNWSDSFRFAGDQNVKSYYENDQGGARIVGSIDSGITGEGGDRVVVDDPLKLEDADNKDAIVNVNNFWDDVLASRLNDAATGCRVIIMQRLNHNDLTGHVLREGGWTWLYLPTEYEPARKCFTQFRRTIYEVGQDEQGKLEERQQVVDIMFEDPRTHEAELLNPQRFGPQEVAIVKVRNGPYTYAGQQQQRPVPQGGGVYKREYWRFFDVDQPPFNHQEDLLDDACQSWDCSFKDLDDSSYVVGTCWIRRNSSIYLFYRLRRRMDFPATVEAIKTVTTVFPMIGPKLIEDKANGIAVISVLQKQVSGIIARGVPQGGIDALASAVSYLVAAGNVFLPGRRDPDGNLVPAYAWVEEFIVELEQYPKGEHNDQVASMAHALYWYHERPNGGIDLEDLLKEGEVKEPLLPGWIF
jgi:predicted phage terminase large subunit-like protein